MLLPRHTSGVTRIKQIAVIVLMVALLAFPIPAYAQANAETTRDHTWFEGRELGAIVGATHDLTIEKLGGTAVYFNGSAEAAEAVRQGRIDGFVTMLSNARVMAAQMDGFEAIVVPKEFYSGQVAASSADQAVIDRFNAFLSVIREDGTLEEMESRWFSEEIDLDMPMPEIENSGENGVITIATCALSLPYVYMGENGTLKGFSVEMALRFGAYEGKTVEFAEMELSALIPYINSGKAELSVSSMNITEERRKSVLFSEPFHNEQHGILALKQESTSGAAQESEQGGGFIEWLQTGIERNLITDNRWQLILSGLGVTMTIAFFAQLLGTVIGAAVCFLLTRKNRVLSGVGSFYCGLISGLPMVVLLMIAYYIVFGNTGISNVLVAIAAFSVVSGASVAQNLRGAIDTVDSVEIEAARSMGFTSVGAFFSVTLPQAIRRALPGYTGGFVELVKATAIVGYVAIEDLMRVGDLIRGRTYDAYFPLLVVGLIYLIVTMVCIQVFKRIVRKINGGDTP